MSKYIDFYWLSYKLLKNKFIIQANKESYKSHSCTAGYCNAHHGYNQS